MAFEAFCPGAKLIRQPMPEEYPCPNCGEMVEIWTHEFKARCPKCGTTVFREATPSCVEWCQYARQCVGDEVYERYMQEKAEAEGEKGEKG